MSEDLKTIKEIADEIGVSKQAVWQKIKKESSIDLRQFTSKKGNTVYVDVDGQKVIKSAFFNKTSTKSWYKLPIFQIKRVGKTRFAHVNKNVIKYCGELRKCGYTYSKNNSSFTHKT